VAVDATRTLRGALAGAAAAAVWAVQQPLDQRVLGTDFDDVRLLGRLAAARGAAEYPVGLAIHVVNGAAFGAVYANLARVLPVPAPLRGPLAALTEHVVTWPSMPLLLRVRSDLPAAWGSGRALAQATWRHALFGIVLGELERRLNPPEPEPPIDPAAAASNGHGSAEHLVPTP
jgi:hypothetical protein